MFGRNFWLMRKQASVDFCWDMCLFPLQCYTKKLKPNKFLNALTNNLMAEIKYSFLQLHTVLNCFIYVKFAFVAMFQNSISLS